METDTLIQREATSINDIIDKLGFGRFQYLICVLEACIVISFAVQSFLTGILIFTADKNWDLSDLTVDLYSGAMLLAMTCGFLVSSVVDDRFTRWGISKTSLFIIILSSILLTFSEEITSFLLIRFVVVLAAFMLLSPSFASICEMLPSKNRGLVLAVCDAAAILGYGLVIGLSYIFIPDFEGENWRYMIIIATLLPNCPALFLCYYLIEDSPVYLAKSDYKAQAIRAFERIAAMNKKVPLSQAEKDLIWNYSKEEKQKVKLSELFEPSIKLQTVLLIVIWINSIIGYNGMLSIYPYLIDDDQEDSGTIYQNFLIFMVFSIPALVLYVALIDNPYVGRKNLCIGCSIICLVGLTLPVCYNHDISIVIGMGLYSAFKYASMMCIYIYTAEVYNTYLRSFSMSFLNLLARGIIVFIPYLFLLLIDLSSTLGFITLAALEISILVCFLKLPYETRGLVLDSLDKVIN